MFNPAPAPLILTLALDDVAQAYFDALRRQHFPPKINYLTAHLTRILGGHDIDWSTHQLSGDPARALGQLAETLRAAMIVVGTRDGTGRGSLQEFFAGSIAMHLAHRQNRPVVVVPLSPTSFDDDAPWESD